MPVASVLPSLPVRYDRQLCDALRSLRFGSVALTLASRLQVWASWAPGSSGRYACGQLAPAELLTHPSRMVLTNSHIPHRRVWWVTAWTRCAPCLARDDVRRDPLTAGEPWAFERALANFSLSPDPHDRTTLQLHEVHGLTTAASLWLSAAGACAPGIARPLAQ
jgi:hypothetical protein